MKSFHVFEWKIRRSNHGAQQIKGRNFIFKRPSYQLPDPRHGLSPATSSKKRDIVCPQEDFERHQDLPTGQVEDPFRFDQMLY